MPTVQANGINIYYVEEGQGPPLLMIMGFGGQHHSWGDETVRLLSRHFRTIRFDNRGTGHSDKPQVEYSIAMMADDAAGLLQALGLSRAHVYGVSMGGMIAQELALRHPHLVGGLVLGCTTPGWAKGVPPRPEVIQLMMPEPGLSREEQIRKSWPAICSPRFLEEGREFLELMLRRSLENPTPVDTMNRQAAAIQAFDSYDRLPQIRAPTLIIHGDQDVLIPPQNAYILHERIPGSRLVIIEGAGHVYFWEKPAESCQAIVEFLSQVPMKT
jgi:pimeloyl-ACP methyl ester carboxylesterase